VRATANPPALAAAEVFGDRLQAHLEVLARVLQPHVPALERRFLDKLRRLGYDPRQRKALAAITPGAAAALLAARGLPPEFVEQVEYNGRRLAKLKLEPVRIVSALQEYDRLLAPIAGALDAAGRGSLRQALEQWYFCVVLTLNNAFYQVGETEAQTYHELFRNELESQDLDELLLQMLESLSRFCQAEAGALYLRDRATSLWWRIATTLGGEPQVAPKACVTIPAGALRRLAKGQCMIAGRGAKNLPLEPAWRQRLATCWSVPLTLEGRLIGIIQFGFAKSYEWLPREVEVLTAAAERCVLAAEKARLMQELAAREAQIRELAGHMLQVEERERRRISSELHDEAGQSLMCIRLQLEMLEMAAVDSCATLRPGLGEVRALTERTIVEIRRLLSALSPAVLEELGLAPALRQLVTRLRRLNKIQVRPRIGPLPLLPSVTTIAVYRLAQECLNNVVRHSAASRVNISVDSADERLRLSVEDDGVGFRVKEALSKRGSFGLAGMSERVALLGGKFHVDSHPGRGTRVLIELPIPAGKGPQDPGS